MMRLMKRKLTFVGAICAVLAVIALCNGALAQADGASEQGGKITFQNHLLRDGYGHEHQRARRGRRAA